jgi:hypothetical protein
MNKLTTLALALILAACSETRPDPNVEAPPPAAPAPLDEAESASERPEGPTAGPALLEAANAYVRANAAEGFEFGLEVQAVEGDFARIAVRPRQPDDGAMLFMQRTANGWTGMDMGTAISCADLRAGGMPESLCVGIEP